MVRQLTLVTCNKGGGGEYQQIRNFIPISVLTLPKYVKSSKQHKNGIIRSVFGCYRLIYCATFLLEVYQISVNS